MDSPAPLALEAGREAAIPAATANDEFRILTFSTLFPNAETPHHGVFVENRLRHLLAGSRVSARVIAPVPWFPWRNDRFGDYARFARVPDEEYRNGVPVLHPRYPLIPKVGMTPAPLLMYLALRPVVRKLIRDGFDFQLIDAHYFYPDGVAAILLGRDVGRPVTITARGTDLNLIPQYRLPRRWIRWAADRAAGLITVCQALKDSLVDLGVDGDRVRVLRNGVDLEAFRPTDRAAARRRLAVDGPTLVSVGHLIHRKAHDLVIAALPELPGVNLLIVGEGPEDEALRQLAGDLGVTDRVRFMGRIAHADMREVYAAADALVLASSREGWANVLLEAMACGTPVVASNVWGTPEVVAVSEAGLLMAERTAAGVAEAVRRLLADLPDRSATRAYAEQFSWDATTEGQLEVFRAAIAGANGQA